MGNIVRITLRLNIDCPEDAAIYDALMQTSPGRLNQRIRHLLEMALGLEQSPVREPAKPKPNPANILPFESKPAPKDESAALDDATANFMNAFGGLAK